MNWKDEYKKLIVIVVIFIAAFSLPLTSLRFANAIFESLNLLKDYARQHVLLCLVPAFFIAGAISVFLSQGAVMKYLGPRANKIVAYSVASVSGSILAVCSCTVLPLFAGIYRMGAGLGPAAAFLYSGPAINILAIILTAKILGMEIGIARAVGAVAFSIIIGLLMHFIYRKDELVKAENAAAFETGDQQRPLGHNMIFFATLVAILVFANWAKPAEQSGLWYGIYSIKWVLTSVFAVILGVIVTRWFKMKIWKIIITATAVAGVGLVTKSAIIAFSAGVVLLSFFMSTAKSQQAREWFWSSWGFAKLILPLLFMGVLVAGFLLGRPGNEGIIPSQWIAKAVGGNSIRANFFASIAGAFMYFATLTEVPILQGLIW
ncbi:MAG: permease, partial [Phycisphaerae bacterium]|nr:permease [Phycisphaerae bacterium]